MLDCAAPMRSRRALAFSLLISANAAAQPSDAAVAEALFRAGRELLDQGKIDEACEKFGDSQRLEPKLGTLLNLAACHEKQDKTASAWAEFTQAEAQASALRRPDHQEFARRHLKALSARLSTLTIRWSNPATDETVALDGTVVGAAAIDTQLPVDPGEHVIGASAPGHIPFEQRTTVARGPVNQTIEIPELALTPAQSTPESNVEPPPSKVGAPARPTPTSASKAPEALPMQDPASTSTRKPIAIGLFAAGVVAAGVGTYAGLRAFSKKHEAQDECDGAACSQRGLDLYSEVDTAADISTVAFAVSIGALGAGAYLWFTGDAPRAKEAAKVQVAIGKAGAAAVIGGSF